MRFQIIHNEQIRTGLCVQNNHPFAKKWELLGSRDGTDSNWFRPSKTLMGSHIDRLRNFLEAAKDDCHIETNVTP